MNNPYTESDRTILEGLDYIASSPPKEFGGFHPNAVTTASKAAARLRELIEENARMAKDLKIWRRTDINYGDELAKFSREKQELCAKLSAAEGERKELAACFNEFIGSIPRNAVKMLDLKKLMAAVKLLPGCLLAKDPQLTARPPLGTKADLVNDMTVLEFVHDLSTHGLRFDLSPTHDLNRPEEFWHHYLKRADDSIKERATSALSSRNLNPNAARHRQGAPLAEGGPAVPPPVPCTCGNPSALGILHRKDGPCYQVFMNHQKLIEELTNAFLQWPLPESVCADLCATQQKTGRIGTNLLTFTEAKQMFTDIVLPRLQNLGESTRTPRKEFAPTPVSPAPAQVPEWADDPRYKFTPLNLPTPVEIDFSVAWELMGRCVGDVSVRQFGAECVALGKFIARHAPPPAKDAGDADWKQWVRFVLGPAGLNNPTDDELKCAVCKSWDALIIERDQLRTTAFHWTPCAGPGGRMPTKEDGIYYGHSVLWTWENKTYCIAPYTWGTDEALKNDRPIAWSRIPEYHPPVVAGADKGREEEVTDAQRLDYIDQLFSSGKMADWDAFEKQVVVFGFRKAAEAALRHARKGGAK